MISIKLIEEKSPLISVKFSKRTLTYWGLNRVKMEKLSRTNKTSFKLSLDFLLLSNN